MPMITKGTEWTGQNSQHVIKRGARQSKEEEERKEEVAQVHENGILDESTLFIFRAVVEQKGYNAHSFSQQTSTFFLLSCVAVLVFPWQPPRLRIYSLFF